MIDSIVCGITERERRCFAKCCSVCLSVLCAAVAAADDDARVRASRRRASETALPLSAASWLLASAERNSRRAHGAHDVHTCTPPTCYHRYPPQRLTSKLVVQVLLGPTGCSLPRVILSADLPAFSAPWLVAAAPHREPGFVDNLSPVPVQYSRAATFTNGGGSEPGRQVGEVGGELLPVVVEAPTPTAEERRSQAGSRDLISSWGRTIVLFSPTSSMP